MTRYSAAPVLVGLKDFQRATVDHVIDRFFGPNPTRRFLIADETGMGKSVVARGVIARLLEKLQDDDAVQRVDVVYICSNQDVARQNLAHLEVAAGQSIALSSRLTLLAKHSTRLDQASTRVGKPLNLVAFTPGTSFEKGWKTGQVEERALLFLILEQQLGGGWDGWRRGAAVRALQGGVQETGRFERRIDGLWNELGGRIDRRIVHEFITDARRKGLLRAFNRLLDDVGRRRTLPSDLARRAAELIGELRSCLARAGVETLEPDLVILDEFQRFRHLLDRNDGGEAAELAHDLFDYSQARVLLLSATPYKPFTYAEEAAAGEDHYEDFLRTLRFLCDDPAWNAAVTGAFSDYRDTVVRGSDTARVRHDLRRLLLQVMTRTERPSGEQAKMLRERGGPADDCRGSDLRGYVTLRRIADHLDAPISVEYWKSAPYFLNFTDGYQVGDKLRGALRAGTGDELVPFLEPAQLLEASALRSYKTVDLGNARLRRLAADTIERDWWKLLWVPPSMPHYRLGEPFQSVAESGMTKRLVFSSWTAAPSAIAGLLSYEADRRLFGGRLTANDPGERRRIAGRLDYRLDGDRPAAMTTVALFWPHPGLAQRCDPLRAARNAADEFLQLSAMEAAVRKQILTQAPFGERAPQQVREQAGWAAFFRWPGAAPGVSAQDVINALSRTVADTETEQANSADSSGVARHVELALRTIAAGGVLDAVEVGDLASLGMHAPGNIAWRGLDRLIDPQSTVTPAGHWQAAATLAAGLRSLFNRPETISLIEQLEPERVYWRAVLRYSAAGGLQALIDEYLHHLRSEQGDQPLDDDGLLQLATAAADAISLRPSRYTAFDPRQPETPIPLTSRFALRYGTRRGDEESARRPEVRAAFNSPFWPFILTTTSAGQEGIDFHWWCAAVVHWNLPANPVDFEQREGRVHRFGGHAIRRNLAARHRATALHSGEPDVWKAAYDAARRESGPLGDFAPYWVYPGAAKIERHILPYPLSRDVAKLDQLRHDLALYRLAFGQPRQEDMLTLLQRHGITETQAAASTLDLTPPRNSWPQG